MALRGNAFGVILNKRTMETHPDPALPPTPTGPSRDSTLLESRNAAVMESLLKSTPIIVLIFGVFCLLNFLGYYAKQFRTANAALHIPLIFIDGAIAAAALVWGRLARRKRIPARFANLSAALFTWLAMATIIYASVQIPEYYLQQQTFFMLAAVWAGAAILSHRWFLVAVIPPALLLLACYVKIIDWIASVQGGVAVFCFISCAWVLHSIRYAYWFRSEHLRQLALGLVRSHNEAETARRLIQHASGVLGTRSWVLQTRATAGEFTYRCGRGKMDDWAPRKPWMEKLFERARGNPTDLSPLNPAGEPGVWGRWRRRGTGGVLGIPLSSGKELRTVVWFERRGWRRFNIHEFQFAGTCAVYARQALDAIGLHQQVERLATVDELTQLFNRRQFFFLADRELHRRGRSFRSLAVLMADIDHFKKINDTWGHPAGDAVLAEVARRLQAGLREMDIVGRYGGEEFALMLLDSERKDALEVAERLRRSIESAPVTFGGNVLPVTLSLGVAMRSTEEDIQLDALVARADRALYRAKETGRNRVVVAD
jgi:diguanylate cyclase (GGDEF)-like protein